MRYIKFLLDTLDGLFLVRYAIMSVLGFAIIVLLLPFVYIFIAALIFAAQWVLTEISLSASAATGKTPNVRGALAGLLILALLELAPLVAAIHWCNGGFGSGADYLCKGNVSHGFFLLWDIVDIFDHLPFACR
jgi:Na+-translocating ferredoxin:NAD+ oxidoreductase RnfD subunit